MKLENPKTVVAVKGLILNDEKALIIKRGKNVKFGEGTWECVGGKINFGEDLEMALVREAKEEVGLEIAVEKILYATSYLSPERHLIILTYLCRSEKNNVVLSEEHLDYRWCTKEQLRQLLPANILNDFQKNNVFSEVQT
jgi:8-oxo-dGTP diphosphatase